MGNTPCKETDCRSNAWWRHPPASVRAAVLALLTGCLAVGCGQASRGSPTKSYVISVVKRDLPHAERRRAIRDVFAKKPTRLIEIIFGLDHKKRRTPDIQSACQIGLVDILTKEHYEMLLSAMAAAPHKVAQCALAKVLSRNQELITAVAANPDPVLEMLEEAKFPPVVFYLSEALSLAKVERALSIIVSKQGLGYSALGGRESLDPSLIRLGHRPTLSKYGEMVASPRRREQFIAIDALAQSNSPRVIKLLVPLLGNKRHPKPEKETIGGLPWPLYRYCDVAVSFARHFKENRPGQPAYDIPSCSDEEIEEVKRWWKTVKDTEKYS